MGKILATCLAVFEVANALGYEDQISNRVVDGIGGPRRRRAATGWRDDMKINHGRVDGEPSAHRDATFTGAVWSEPLLRGVPGVIINTVFFPPGVRTDWHRHEIGQILIVTHGRGLAVNEGGDRGAIMPGDVVWFDPGERHWHGAGPDTWVSHIAISLGTTDWEDAVSDDDYAAGG